MNKIFVLSALISALAAQSVASESIDSKIIDEIRNEYNEFIPAANAAISDIVAHDNVTAEAAKKALDGQITVPTSYNETTVKSLLTAAPQILQYPAILDIIDTKVTENPTYDDVLSFTLEGAESSPPIDNSTVLEDLSVEFYNSKSESTPKYIKQKSKNSKARRVEPRTLYKIRDNYKNFNKAANAAIADIVVKNRYVAKAIKKELNGQLTVPRKYNEATIKAILFVAPQILEYPAVRNSRN
ncbi:hypothetical protein BB561_000959 [Smittium simulii]|uniref:Uncharacterized protein n=1 Tax=Smittium simulii TaxID=133385 RepID=A0A2T9YWV0_9FUNG|nr:hypothetical protein BB561_000959 [Smittium simulii]